MKRFESIKRIAVLWMSFVGLLMQVGVYAFLWLRYYYPMVSNFTRRLKFYRNGHFLMLGIYLLLLFFFTNTYGGMKIGYLKPMDVFLSQMFSLLIVNIITYFQISLMNNWLVPVDGFLAAMLLQLLIAALWSFFCNALYQRVFPPRKMLLVHGEREIDDILHKFESRRDKYKITRCMDVREGLGKVEQEILEGYGAVVLWDISTGERNHLLKYCYSRSVRVYTMPKIPDVLMKGSEQLHLFDTPIFLTREYALTLEQRAAKRAIDLVCSLLLLVIGSPFMLATAAVIKCYDGGPVLYKQVRCTRDGRKFEILKFRSMRVDAEKDGVARLAARNDGRVTPVGKFIRAVRIDELPQLFNILKGDMSLIGPRPLLVKYLPLYNAFQKHRHDVKPGLTGWAQVNGRNAITWEQRFEYDVYYVKHLSFWMDLKIMFLTVAVVFRHSGISSATDATMEAFTGTKNSATDQGER